MYCKPSLVACVQLLEFGDALLSAINCSPWTSWQVRVRSGVRGTGYGVRRRALGILMNLQESSRGHGRSRDADGTFRFPSVKEGDSSS